MVHREKSAKMICMFLFLDLVDYSIFFVQCWQSNFALKSAQVCLAGGSWLIYCKTELHLSFLRYAILMEAMCLNTIWLGLLKDVMSGGGHYAPLFFQLFVIQKPNIEPWFIFGWKKLMDIVKEKIQKIQKFWLFKV